jgi:hypothetical protein
MKRAILPNSEPYETGDKRTWHRKARQILKKMLSYEIQLETKIQCPNCKVEKEITEFSNDPARFGWCNRCHAYWIEERYI